MSTSADQIVITWPLVLMASWLLFLTMGSLWPLARRLWMTHYFQRISCLLLACGLSSWLLFAKAPPLNMVIILILVLFAMWVIWRQLFSVFLWEDMALSILVFLFFIGINCIFDVTLPIFYSVASVLFSAMTVLLTTTFLFRSRNPFLRLMQGYCQGLLRCFDDYFAKRQGSHMRSALFLPDDYQAWVLASGLALPFRAGYRFYVLEMERLLELGCAFASCDEPWLQNDAFFAEALDESLRINQRLTGMLLAYFLQGKWPECFLPREDTESDLRRLEGHVINASEWNNEMSRRLLVHQVGEMRQILLQLLQALPS